VNTLPEKWFVLYSNKEEFDIINTHYKKDWNYFPQTSPPTYGYCNINGNNNWIANHEDTEDDEVWNIAYYKTKGAVEISFKNFRKWVLNEQIQEESYDYLIEIFKKLKIE